MTIRITSKALPTHVRGANARSETNHDLNSQLFSIKVYQQFRGDSEYVQFKYISVHGIKQNECFWIEKSSYL